MNNIFNLVEIVQKAKAPYVHFYYEESKDIEKSPILNYKHKDGRIFASHLDDDNHYTAVTVSPYHPLFETQIEDGIKPIVFSLLNKNYIVISSCEGHDQYFDNPAVRLAFASDDDRSKFISLFKDYQNIIFDKKEISANVELYNENGITKARVLEDYKFSKKQETISINNLFFRNYDSYCFLDLKFFPYSKKWWHFFHKYYIRKIKRKYWPLLKEELSVYITSSQFPYYEK